MSPRVHETPPDDEASSAGIGAVRESGMLNSERPHCAQFGWVALFRAWHRGQIRNSPVRIQLTTCKSQASSGQGLI
ncbi:MAG TPA: hypothetical protein VGN09_07435 [Vicinamibacteria bacterium]